MLRYQYHNQPLISIFDAVWAAIIRVLNYNFFLIWPKKVSGCIKAAALPLMYRSRPGEDCKGGFRQVSEVPKWLRNGSGGFLLSG